MDADPVRGRTRIRAGLVAGALVVAALVRLTPWQAVFTPAGVRLVGDGDVYYHALRARVLAQEHRVLWRDPGLSHPTGAEVPWPPFFDAVIAVPAWLGSGPTPSADAVERAAALVPVVLAVLGVLACAWLASALLGPTLAGVAAFILAVVPTHAAYSVLGRADHHVLEVLLLTGMLALYARALGRDHARAGWGASLALGALVAAAFWTWVGSAFHVAVLCLVAAAAHVLSPRGDDSPRVALRLLGRGMAVAALLTAITVALLGPPGALGRVAFRGVSAMQVLLAAGAAAWCLAVHAAARRAPDAGVVRRLLEALAAAVVTGTAILVASAGARAAVAHALGAAGHGREWEFINEAQSLLSRNVTLGARARAVLDDFGLLPLLGAAGVVELVSWWRSPERRPRAIALATLGIVFGALVAHMRRFGYYGAIPLALFAAMGLAAVARAGARLGPRASWAAVSIAAIAAAASVAPTLRAGPAPTPRLDDVARVVGPLRDGTLPPGGAILARWDEGHHARYFSGRPVVASPLGSDVDPQAMADVGAFFLAEDPSSAGAILARRDVRWIVVDRPASAVLEAAVAAGTPAPPVTQAWDPVRGPYVHCEESFDRLVVARLYYDAGSSSPRNARALGEYRLVAEVGPRGGPVSARLFEAVKGAVLEVSGAAPARPVVATTAVRTPLGTFTWKASGAADGSGRVRLTVPFATGRNGTVLAAAYEISDGFTTASLSTSEEQVSAGAVVPISLASGR